MSLSSSIAVTLSKDERAHWALLLRLLARRERTVAELKALLAQRHVPPVLIDALVARAQALGLLDDSRAAATAIQRLAPLHGDRALYQHLANRGLAPEIIDRALAQARSEFGEEQRRAVLLWQRKFGHPPRTRQEWNRQAGYFARRGFSPSTIGALLQAPPVELPDDGGYGVEP
ncbi:MAG: recombination regulator RecX [Hydrogenophilus sp.]|nr:recombination regulator RecX [Hydrogenophilus sp.]